MEATQTAAATPVTTVRITNSYRADADGDGVADVCNPDFPGLVPDDLAPRGALDPAVTLVSATLYDTNGNTLSISWPTHLDLFSVQGKWLPSVMRDVCRRWS